ncbi:MAG: hypothetical protein RJB38_1456 [Pseudomonadota bacterium]|jgi:hypothetical protein
MNQLTTENYLKGFLIDDELMGGVSSSEEGHLAFILRHTTGEYLGSQVFQSLSDALDTINAVQRQWKYESASECGGGACQEGACGTGSCKKVLAQLGATCSH